MVLGQVGEAETMERGREQPRRRPRQDHQGGYRGSEGQQPQDLGLHAHRDRDAADQERLGREQVPVVDHVQPADGLRDPDAHDLGGVGPRHPEPEPEPEGARGRP